MFDSCKKRVLRLWQLLWRPSLPLGKMVDAGDKSTSVSVMLLAGPVLVLIWADFWGLGSKFSTGQILSTALVLGPLIGLFWPLLLAFFGMCIGHLLGQSHAAQLAYHPLVPPFPLKNLVWRKLFAAETLRKMFAWPVFRQYLVVWSWGIAIWKYLKERLGFRSNRFIQNFALANRSMAILTILVPLLSAGMFAFGNAGFGSTGGYGRWIGLVVSGGIALHFVWVWSVAFRLAYRLQGLRAMVGAALSLLISLGSLVGTLVFLIGIRLF
jgi:hypothetical protein